MDFQFLLRSMSTSAVPLTSQVTAQFLAHAAAACEIQMNRDFARHWGGTCLIRTGVNLLPGESDFQIVDTLPDAGAIAEHATNAVGAPVLTCSLSMCSSLDEVTTAASHEFGETMADPSCNRWADDNNGSLFAIEPFDPIEQGYYDIDLGGGILVRVSDFVLPAFFNPGAPPPYSFKETMGAPPSILQPFQTAPGGYQIKRDGSGTIVQVNGMLSAYQIAKIKAEMGRTRRRGFDHRKHRIVDMQGYDRRLESEQK